MLDKKLLQLFAKRFAIALGGVSLLAFFFIWGPYLNARNIVLSEIERREDNRETRAQARQAITRLALPGSITTQKVGAAKAYADDVKVSADSINEVTLTPPPKLKEIRFTPIPGLRSLITDVNEMVGDPAFGQRYGRTAQGLSRADRLLSYHAEVMTALVNVLEYAPTLDFQTFDLNSDDTKERLKRAKEGLDKTVTRLEEAKGGYEDGSFDEVVSAVTTLQEERSRLEQGGPMSQWVRAVSVAQNRLLGNRTAFWKDESTAILTDLEEVEKELLQILEQWVRIQNRFDL